MARLTTDDLAVLNNAINELKTVTRQLEFVSNEARFMSDEAINAIIGHSTRQASERLNVVRDQWGFDAVNRDEAGDLETDDCPECARSFGPHYQGECQH